MVWFLSGPVRVAHRENGWSGGVFHRSLGLKKKKPGAVSWCEMGGGRKRAVGVGVSRMLFLSDTNEGLNFYSDMRSAVGAFILTSLNRGGLDRDELPVMTNRKREMRKLKMSQHLSPRATSAKTYPVMEEEQCSCHGY